MNKFATLVTTAVLALSATAANAAVSVGDTVTCSQVGGGSYNCNQASAVIGAGNEFYVGDSGDGFNANFSAGQLLLTAVNPPLTIGNTIIRFTDLTHAFTGASITNTTGAITGLTGGDVTVSNGVLQIDLRNTTWSRLSSATLTLTGAGAVPEPATWAMMILGFGVVSAAARRRTTTKVVYA